MRALERLKFNFGYDSTFYLGPKLGGIRKIENKSTEDKFLLEHKS